jgi:hypothetical protein
MTWSQNSNKLITRAYLRCGLLAEGQVISSSQLSIGLDELNSIIEELHNKGFNEWQLEWKKLALTASSIVTNGGNIYTCRVSHTSSSDTEPGVGSLWKTVWELTGTGGSAWLTSTSYSSIGDFTYNSTIQDILYIWIKDNYTDDIILEKLSQEKYFDISKKFLTGKPDSFFIDYTLNANKVYFYPQPDSSNYIINYRVINYITDMISGSTPNFLKRWYPYLVDALAYSFSCINRFALDERSFYKKRMEESLYSAKGGEFNIDNNNHFVKGAIQ